MKLYKWFYWTSNPQFRKKSQSVPGARSSLVPPCKISLGGPEWWYALLAYVVVNLTTIRSWPQWPLLLCRRYPSLTNAQLGVYVDFIYPIEIEYNAQLGVYVDFIPLNLNIMHSSVSMLISSISLNLNIMHGSVSMLISSHWTWI